MDFYTYTGENIKSDEFTFDRIIFEGDEAEKVVEAGIPVKLSEDEINYLIGLGFILDKSSEVESEAVQSAIKDWQESGFDSDYEGTPFNHGEITNNPLDSGPIHRGGELN